MTLSLPTIGGDVGSWGGILNPLLLGLDSRITSLEGSTVANRGVTAIVYGSTVPSALRPAATNASAYVWVCDGTGDEVEINAAITAVNALGAGQVFLVGEYFAISGSIVMRSGVYLRGESIGCEVKAMTAISAGMISVYDLYTHATEVSHLFLNGNNQAGTHGIYYNNYDVSHTQAHNAQPRTNPDTAHLIHDLFIRDCGDATTAGHGIILWDWASRANKVNDIRIQSVTGSGVIVGCADSHFVNVEVGSSGSGGPTWSEGSTPSGATPTWNAIGHGFVIYQGNNLIQACKAWYSRGHGFYARSTQNQIENCQAQDNYRDGYKCGSGKNNWSGCIADSNNQANGSGNVNGTTYAGFRFTGASTVAEGLLAFDRGQGWTQAYGIVVTSGATYSLISGVTYANLTAGLSNATPTGTTVTVVQDASGK